MDFGTALVKEQAVVSRFVFRHASSRTWRRGRRGRTDRRPSDTRGQKWHLSGVYVCGGACAFAATALGAAETSQLHRARAEAQTAVALATRDRERAERLTSAGAAPGKRLDEARAIEEQAKARLTAADASLSQYHAARAGGTSDAEGLFIIRAPVSGVIALRDAVTGANVTAGHVLFRLVDAAQIHVVGQVPESQAARARLAQAAEIEITGQPDRVPTGRLVNVGKVLDPQSRTLPITFAFDNRTLELPVGQAAFLHLLMKTTQPRPVVPALER